MFCMGRRFGSPSAPSAGSSSSEMSKSLSNSGMLLAQLLGARLWYRRVGGGPGGVVGFV